MKTIVAFLSVFALTSCQSNKTNETTKERVNLYEAPESIAIPPISWRATEKSKITFSDETFNTLPIPGDVFFPTFHAKEKVLAYSSSMRKQHEHFEIYKFDIASEKEQRLTHQVSNALHPSFHPHQPQIVFASLNYEPSEREDLFLKKLRKRIDKNKGQTVVNPPFSFHLPPAELAIIEKNTQRRVTRSKEYDASPQFMSNGRRILLTSSRFGNPEIISLDLRGRQVKRLTNHQGYDGQAVLSQSGKSFVFVRSENGSDTSSLQVYNFKSKKIDSIKTETGLHLWPQWDSSDEWIIFTSLMKGTSFFSIYAIHRTGNCLTRLDNDATHALFARVHPDGDKIYYSKWDGLRWTLGWKSLQLPQTCVVQSP